MAAIKRIVEAALLTASRPLPLTDLERLFEGDTEAPPRDAIRQALAELDADWQHRCLAVQQIASGYRAQVRGEFEPWIARLWDEKPPRHSRALLETLAIIAYRQPMTRSEIEEIRGVSVSSQIIRTLTEREWVRIVGHREAPGRPALYGTTRAFLDYFNLQTLDELPPVSEVRDLEQQYPELGFEREPARPDAEAGATAEPGAEAAAPTESASDAPADADGDLDDASHEETDEQPASAAGDAHKEASSCTPVS
jgi:segregation and condensation protein B